MFQFIIYSFLDYRLGQFELDRGEVKLHYEHSSQGIHFGVVAVVAAVALAVALAVAVAVDEVT